MADETHRHDKDVKQPYYRDDQPPPHHHHNHPQHPLVHHQPAPPRSTMATTVGLPSMQDSRGYASPVAPQPPPPPHGQTPGARPPYPHDARYIASPNAANGYPSPSPSAGQQTPSTFLPPLQPGLPDPRSPAYPPPPDQRGNYYEDRRPPQYPDHHQAQQYPEAYFYRGAPAGPVPPNGYPRPPQPAYPDYGQSTGAPPAMSQAAPRQRTSIACRYCRKRKIRCSGYQNTPGGKCQNCARMNQECIFQPVSSSSSTAFIPVSAVPGGVPPGTQLFGAYGQPLAPNAVQVAHPYPPPPHHHHHSQQPGPASTGPPPPYYPQPPQQHHAGPPPPQPQPQPQQSAAPQPTHQPTQSPTESYSSYGDENSQVVGRRRRRTPEDRDDSFRMPPPRVGVTEEEPHHRSPAEFSNNSSPGGLSQVAFQAPRQSPRNAPVIPQSAVQQQPRPSPTSSQNGKHNGSNGSSTPRSQSQSSHAAPGKSTKSSVMSLSNLVEKNDIDRTMIDRLNSRDAKSAVKAQMET
ncbi:hypothetical protein CDD82_822 [Ophiocordyceps australis]|uniref:Zn(2)-C6 fungal-type domain-containing protein n=1 Tax=Ophiocordyceps australis TaxID=1399860 RepID=A0A2C5YH92_9HYPO|nr:hypothetical protein CDD82_822 [Ophiocordyceps australis]